MYSVGSILEAGTVIATFVLDDPSKVRTATVYEGKLPGTTFNVKHPQLCSLQTPQSEG